MIRPSFAPPSSLARPLAWALATAAILVLGGANWTMPLSRLLTQILGCGVLVAALAARPASGRAHMTTPDRLWLALFVLFAAHLLPLPPQVWMQLPGREIAVVSDRAVFGELPWRPLSLDPDATLDSLAMLLPAFALYVAVRLGNRDRRQAILAGVAIAALLGVFAGLLQLSAPGAQILHFYPRGDYQWPVGFFTNRNHQATFLLSALPVCAILLAGQTRRHGAMRSAGILTGAAMILAVGVLVTGSRSGSALLPLAVAGTALAWRGIRRAPPRTTELPPARRSVRAGAAGMAGAAILVLGILALAGSESLTAVFRRGDVISDQRFDFWPFVISASMHYWPWGSGIGTFLTGYQLQEPLESLSPLYLNHAHNDFLEIFLEAGVPGLILALVCLAELGAMSWRAWRSGADGHGPGMMAARLASVAVCLPVLHSLLDYPLRTISISSVFAISVALMATVMMDEDAGDGGRPGLDA